MSPIFISYTGSDRAWADWIAAELDAAGYAVRYQARDFRPGGNFVAEMDEALKLAACTLAVYSRDYQDSPFCQLEWKAALAQDPGLVLGRLLLVRVKDVEPAGALKPIAYVDLTGVTDIAEARGRLLAGVKSSPAAAASAGAAPPPDGRRRTRPPPFPPQRLQRIAWRAGIGLAAWATGTVGVAQYLGRVFPRWMADSPFELNAAAVVCGAVVALVLDAALQWAHDRRPAGGVA